MSEFGLANLKLPPLLKKLAKSFHNKLQSNLLMQLPGIIIAHLYVISSYHVCKVLQLLAIDNT
jgi:hypothetical protein